MSAYTYNFLGQRIGLSVPGWRPPPWPPHNTLAGRFCRIEPLDAERHAADLYAANLLDRSGRQWTYLPYGPFNTEADYIAWLTEVAAGKDPQFYAIIDQNTAQAVGVASYLRINPDSGSIEVGHLIFSPRLQRTPAATEAMVLMMAHAFDLGYRRYEWKCDALNGPSRAAAQRLGLSFEGVFRQATVYKGRSRDTAWFAAIDSEWPALKAAFNQWLAEDNFDAQGRQRQRLSALTRPLLKQHD